MKDLTLQEISKDLLSVLEKTSIPLQLEDLTFMHLAPIHKNPKKILDSYQNLTSQLIWELTAHSFYYRNLGTGYQICTIIYLSFQQFEQQKDFLVSLFDKVTILSGKISQKKETLLLIKLQHISSLGLQMVQKMKCKKFLSPALCRLYLSTAYAADYHKQSLFRIVSNNHADCSYAPDACIKSFLEDPLRRSIDISSLTLQECTEFNFIRYIVKTKKNVYIRTEESPAESGIFQKILCW